MGKKEILDKINELREALKEVGKECPNPSLYEFCIHIAIMLSILDNMENEIKAMSEEEFNERMEEIELMFSDI